MYQTPCEEPCLPRGPTFTFLIMRNRNCIIFPFFDLTFWKLRATLYTQPQQPWSHTGFFTSSDLHIIYMSLYIIYCILWCVWLYIWCIYVCESYCILCCDVYLWLYIWCENGWNKLLSGIRCKLWTAKHATHMCQLVIRFSNPFDKELENKFLSKVDFQSLRGKDCLLFLSSLFSANNRGSVQATEGKREATLASWGFGSYFLELEVTWEALFDPEIGGSG